MNELYWIILAFGVVCVGAGVWWLMFPGRRGGADPHARMGRIQDKHSPEQTRWEARKETKAAEARTEEATQIGAEARAVKDMIVQQTEAIEAQHTQDQLPGRLDEQRILEQAQVGNQLTVIGAADKDKLTPASYEAKRMLEEQSRIKVDEAKQLSELAVTEHEQRTRIDIQNRWQEIVQDLDAADLLAISEQQLLKKLRTNLVELERERYQISKGDDPAPVKKRILARYDKDIAYLGELIDARQAGRILPENEKEARRLAEGSPDSRADYPAEAGEDDI